MDHQKKFSSIYSLTTCAWDNANDFSYQGIMDDSEIVPKIPYDNR